MIQKMKSKVNVRSIPLWNRAEYLLLRGAAGVVNALPIGVSTGIARGIGDLLYYGLPKRKKIASANLDQAFKGSLSPEEKQKIVRETFRSLATSLMEFFRVPSMLKEASERVEFEGTEILDKAFKRGKGIIFTISHLGSWEYLAFLPYLRKYPCSVVVRPAKNPYIYQWIQGLRRKTGLHPIDRTHAAKKILQCLKKNELVAILIDQWAGGEGIWADFFGRATSTTSIPVRLADKTGAALIPGYCVRLSAGKYKIIIRPEISIVSGEDYEKKTTEKLNRLLETEINRYPSQWSWAHRRWKSHEHYMSTRK